LEYNVSQEWILLVLRLLAVAVLYVFLFIVIYVIWRDLQSSAPIDSQQDDDLPAQEPFGYLRVVRGGDTPLQSGDSFPLNAHTTLGRAADNHVVLPDTYVSSYHARLDHRDGEWWLSDLDSRNGTRLNDVPISKPVPLVDGDIIGVGQVELKLEIENQMTVT
jgi:hypothetical protein